MSPGGFVALTAFTSFCGWLTYEMVQGWRDVRAINRYVAENDRIDAAVDAGFATRLALLREFYERFPEAEFEGSFETVADLEDLLALPAVTPPHELH